MGKSLLPSSFEYTKQQHTSGGFVLNDAETCKHSLSFTLYHIPEKKASPFQKKIPHVKKNKIASLEKGGEPSSDGGGVLCGIFCLM